RSRCSQMLPCPIVCSMPHRPVRAQPASESLIDLGVRERFGLSVVPPKAPEGSEIWRKVLLEIRSEAVFTRDAPGMICDLWLGHKVLVACQYRIAIDSHIRVVGVSQGAHHASFARQKPAAQLIFPVLRINLPRAINQVGAVSHLGH